MTVELRRRRADGTPETLARIVVAEPGGPAVIQPADVADQGWLEEFLLSAGVVDARGRVLRPSDGEAYVRALASSFRGSRLWAEEVDTSDEENSGLVAGG